MSITIKGLLFVSAMLLTPLIAISAQNKDKTSVVHLTAEEFKEKVADFNSNEWKYKGDRPAIVDFYATWCPPCKRLSPILDELAREYAGEIYVYKIDVDQEKELASAFGIQSVPSLLFIPLNNQPQMAQGAMPKEELVKVIKTVLLKK